MSERDQYQFAEAFEEKTGWDAEDYPNRDVVNLCFSMWQASREALKAEQEGAWIACSERMPEHFGQFSVWNGKHVGLVTFLFGSFQCLNPEQITHWQLAPTPPSQPHPIDTTSQQYETLAKGEKSDS